MVNACVAVGVRRCKPCAIYSNICIVKRLVEVVKRQEKGIGDFGMKRIVGVNATGAEFF